MYMCSKFAARLQILRRSHSKQSMGKHLFLVCVNKNKVAVQACHTKLSSPFWRSLGGSGAARLGLASRLATSTIKKPIFGTHIVDPLVSSHERLSTLVL